MPSASRSVGRRYDTREARINNQKLRKQGGAVVEIEIRRKCRALGVIGLVVGESKDNCGV